MGVKWYHPNVLDQGLQYMQTNALQLHLIKNYAAGDAYATVLANSLASSALAGGDKVLGDQTPSTLGRQLATASKTPNSSASSIVSDDLHVALLDTTNSIVVAVTDETTDQVITSPNPVTIPAINWKLSQPV